MPPEGYMSLFQNKIIMKVGRMKNFTKNIISRTKKLASLNLWYNQTGKINNAMSKYSKDRSFTDYVHKALAIPKIYEPIGWKVKNIDSNKLENLDIKKGIDYILTNSKNNTISIQERFRDAYYKRYTDVTLRFRREFNSDPER